MENNKNSDLEKKEGRIDDLLRVLISLHFIRATLLVIFSGLENVFSVLVFHSKHVRVVTFLLSVHVQTPKKIFVNNFYWTVFLLVCMLCSRQIVI